MKARSAVAAATAAMVALPGCSSPAHQEATSTPAAHASRQTSPAAASPSPPTPTPTPAATASSVGMSCHLGYDGETGNLLPLKAANASYTSAFLATLTDISGHDVTVNGFTEQTLSSTGQIIDTHDIDNTVASGLPRFLAPGESASFLIDFQNLSGSVYVSNADYMKSYCVILATW
ncbi:MAG TPA: hypothetical protein VMV92_22045 [Streptosporangiaceae bacterium]|nr:hypothetical protein [Streptosporangiaceae bacterium]